MNTQEIINAMAEPPHKEETKPILSRAQRRQMERIESDAKARYHAIADQFIKAFTEAIDPESEEIVQLMKKYDAQWRIYCKSKRLTDKAFPLVKEYCESVIKQYFEEKSIAEQSIQHE
jgi:hypothetical protein